MIIFFLILSRFQLPASGVLPLLTSPILVEEQRGHFLFLNMGEIIGRI